MAAARSPLPPVSLPDLLFSGSPSRPRVWWRLPAPKCPRRPSTGIRTSAFYTEGAPAAVAPRKERAEPEADEIALLNERIRREHGRREAARAATPPMDAAEAEEYISMVKEQQQRGLQKLRGGDGEGKGIGGLGYRVDPYVLRPGDYVVHKKVGIGKFAAIKYDVPKDSSSGPIEYVFIEYADGMAKLPVKQASRVLYRYNL